MVYIPVKRQQWSDWIKREGIGTKFNVIQYNVNMNNRNTNNLKNVCEHLILCQIRY